MEKLLIHKKCFDISDAEVDEISQLFCQLLNELNVDVLATDTFLWHRRIYSEAILKRRLLFYLKGELGVLKKYKTKGIMNSKICIENRDSYGNVCANIVIYLGEGGEKGYTIYNYPVYKKTGFYLSPNWDLKGKFGYFLYLLGFSKYN